MIKLKELSFNEEMLLTIGVDENDGSVILVDKFKNTIQLGVNGISLISNTDLNISAKGNIIIEALNVTINAEAGVAVKGNAAAELSASGQTTVKGAMVMIN